MHAEIPYTFDTGEKLVNETFGPNNIRHDKLFQSGGGQGNLLPRQSIEARTLAFF
jgi:hypothetical protein